MTTETEVAAPEVSAEVPAEPTSLLTAKVSETETKAEVVEQVEPAEPEKVEAESEQAGAPESYEFVPPEGVTLAKDAATLAAYSEFAKSLNLTQEQAQEGFAKLVTAQQEQAKAGMAAEVTRWETETRNDPEIGGDKLEATLVKAKQFIATFGDESLTSLLNTGLGNHVAIVRAFAKARDAMADDKFEAGNVGESKPVRDARSLYPNSNMNP